jgi:hypothetical protein
MASESQEMMISHWPKWWVWKPVSELAFLTFKCTLAVVDGHQYLLYWCRRRSQGMFSIVIMMSEGTHYHPRLLTLTSWWDLLVPPSSRTYFFQASETR